MLDKPVPWIIRSNSVRAKVAGLSRQDCMCTRGHCTCLRFSLYMSCWLLTCPLALSLSLLAERVLVNVLQRRDVVLFMQCPAADAAGIARHARETRRGMQEEHGVPCTCCHVLSTRV